MRLTELTGALQPRRILGTADKNVRALKYRSDKCEAGDAFFALRGRDADGHDYLADAAARGAEIFFVEDAEACASLRARHERRTVVEVGNTREALQASGTGTSDNRDHRNEGKNDDCLPAADHS